MSTKKLDVNRKYQHLSHIEHILLRPERHLGSIRSSVGTVWVYDQPKNEVRYEDDFEYTPALIKQFDEIITNCVDHSKTPEGKNLTQIVVTASSMNGQITVSDNGGIPVVKHESGMFVPEMLFSELFAGSNFNDGDEEYENKRSGGQNGEGASLVNVFSKWFRVQTADGNKSYTQTFEDNLSKRSNPVISNSPKEFGTTISWIPDYERLGLNGLNKNNLLMIHRRVFEVAACNPKLTIILNGKPIRIERFGHFVDYFYGGAGVDETEDWSVAVAPSHNATFMHASYVNSIATHTGGPHVEYVMDQIINGIRPALVKKFKTELRPAMIRNHLRLFITASIDRPRFDSQTKERMTTPVSQFGTSYKPSSRLIKKALEFATEGLGKELASLRNDQEDAELEKARKDISKRDFRDIEKYFPATKKGDRSECVLMLTEGDSASNPILAARDTSKIGLFPLRGKFINCLNNSRVKVLANEEFKNLCTILGGATPDKPIDPTRYPFTAITTDADNDGIHIRGLLIAMFSTFWPEYIQEGRLLIMHTPYMRVWVGKKMFEFMNEDEYAEFCKTPDFKKVTKKKYLKGLGGNSTEDFTRFLDNIRDYTTVVKLDDQYKQSLANGFNDDKANFRKTWFSDVNILAVEQQA